MSIRPLFLVFSLLLSPLGLAQGGRTPSSPVTWLDQDRWVEASAHADGAGSYSDSASAPDLGPFQAWADASSKGAFAQAFQHSVVLPDGIIAKGYADSYGFVFGDRNGSSHSSSCLSLRFSVSTWASYQAKGALEVLNFDGFTSSRAVLLRADGTPVFVRETSGSAGIVTIDIDERGLLSPGEYVLTVSAHAAGSGDFWFGGEARYDLALEVQPVSRTVR